MKRNIILLLIGSFVVSMATVVVLFAMSGIRKDKRNSFLRQFPPHPVMEGDTFNIKYNSYYIAGVSNQSIYFGNSVSPLRMLVVRLDLSDSQHVVLNIKGLRDQKFWAPRVAVDSPYFYFTDGAVPRIFKGNVQDWTAEKIQPDSTFFRTILPISPGSFIVKSLSGSTKENIFGKLFSYPPYQFFRDNILQKQLDGVFCTDGMMSYNKELHQLVYLYYYRNQFMVMDTMLNLLYRGNTIDTTSRAKVKTATIESENSKTLSSPPFFVNKGMDTSGDWLFVNSNLLARNDHPSAFDEGSVIDVYNIQNGKYAFSFYIYLFKGIKRMSEFRVFKDKIIVRYDNLIRIWHLEPEYFQTKSAGSNVG
jgi:hypothetical protein